jgi:hypothetical protein
LQAVLQPEQADDSGQNAAAGQEEEHEGLTGCQPLKAITVRPPGTPVKHGAPKAGPAGMVMVRVLLDSARCDDGAILAGYQG